MNDETTTEQTGEETQPMDPADLPEEPTEPMPEDPSEAPEEPPAGVPAPDTSPPEEEGNEEPESGNDE